MRSPLPVFLTVCALAIAPAATAASLIGVTGERATPSETLYLLSTTDATASFQRQLGDGGPGEAIAFNPDDGLLYRVSGDGFSMPRVYEAISGATGPVTSISLSGDGFEELAAMTWWADQGVFLAIDRFGNGSLNVPLLTLTTDGVASVVGDLEEVTKGLAFVGSTLYTLDHRGNAPNPIRLRTRDPFTGSGLSAVNVTLPGSILVPTGNPEDPFVNAPISALTPRSYGLAADPAQGTLYALLHVNVLNAALNLPESFHRALFTIDPATGNASYVGTPQDFFAGLAFVPEPSSAVLTGLGLLALVGATRRRLGSETR